MFALALAAALDELRDLPSNARRFVVSIGRAAELDSIVEVQGVVIERLCRRVFELEARIEQLETEAHQLRHLADLDPRSWIS